MHESRVPLCAVLAVVFWSIGGVLLAAGWLTVASHHHEVANMLGFTGVGFGMLGGTMSVRGYIIRACVLLRRLHGMESDGRDGIRSVQSPREGR